MIDTQDLIVLGIGVSEYKTDGVLRFEHYCQSFDLTYKVLGAGKCWNGGDMANGMGGGQKITETMQELENLDNILVIICDTFDLFPVAGKQEIIKKFIVLCHSNKSSIFNTVVFSSEVYCWPDKNLASSYPATNTKYKFLNSGCIMGYRDSIYNLIKNGNVKNNDDDQLFFTKKYLSFHYQVDGHKTANIMLDHKCELFQTLSGVYDDIVVHKNRIYNHYTDSYPVFIHGNGNAKIFLNNLENYMETSCMPIDYSYTIIKPALSTYPRVFMALYIDSREGKHINFLQNAQKINYANKLIYIYDKGHDSYIQNLDSDEYVYHHDVDDYNFEDFKSSDCEYYFLLEQKCIITNQNILQDLISQCDNHHRIIAPLLSNCNNKMFTNYWGDLDAKGYYKRSHDYMTLINRKLKGIWNCAYVFGAILIHASIIREWNLSAPNKFASDRDMHLCYNFRKNTLFMYMCNLDNYGYMTDN